MIHARTFSMTPVDEDPGRVCGAGEVLMRGLQQKQGESRWVGIDRAEIALEGPSIHREIPECSKESIPDRMFAKKFKFSQTEDARINGDRRHAYRNGDVCTLFGDGNGSLFGRPSYVGPCLA